MPEMTLNKSSSVQAVRDWRSHYIEVCMKEPVPEGTKVDNKQKWCAAKAYSMAREATGKEVS